jgi:hypothetical protein
MAHCWNSNGLFFSSKTNLIDMKKNGNLKAGLDAIYSLKHDLILMADELPKRYDPELKETETGSGLVTLEEAEKYATEFAEQKISARMRMLHWNTIDAIDEFLEILLNEE